MNRILKLSPKDQLAVVEPGVVNSDLQNQTAAHGLFYPPDPASVDFSTLGGNLAENAGGLRAVKYGVTRDYVLGLKAVLPDGRIFRTGTSTMKAVVGYDLTRLLVGSEGTLAVIVEATLKLLPLPEDKATIAALFTELDNAAKGVQAILQSGVKPVIVEFMDSASLKVVENHASLGLNPNARAMLLIELDGPPEVLKRQALATVDVLRKAGASAVNLAQDEKEAEILWQARKSLGPAALKIAPGNLNEDVVVPLGKLTELVSRVQEVARRLDLTIVCYGHAGDGNIHVNIMFDPQDSKQARAAEQAVSDVFAHTLSLGGTLSGEHGVGASKLGYMGAEVDPVALELMQTIKRSFDPAGILNPHKAVPMVEF
jgi:glycolate oxidase subunit GlcD